MTGAPASATRSRDRSFSRPPVNTLWLVNGQSTCVDPADRGLAFGDGLFETMAAHDGTVRWLALHMDRLEEGCSRLEIPAPPRSLLEREIRAHCPPRGSAVVKLVVTRGPGERGYRPPDRATPTRVLAIAPWPQFPAEHYRRGIDVHVLGMRLGENPLLAGLKHSSRLEHVLAQIELRDHAVQQGLLLDTSDYVVGGTSSNVFAVRGRELVTPPLRRCGVKGVMRRAVLETARALGVPAAERELSLTDVLAADELFMTNALVGVWPIAVIDEHRFAVGPVTRRLMTSLGYGHDA